MKLNVQAFLDVLPAIGKGFAGVFIVTAVIIVTMTLLNKVGNNKK